MIKKVVENKKLVIIGIDGACPTRLSKFVKDGHLPNFKKIITNGVFASNCIVPFPTITPPNWATIATGATSGTHGVTCFHVPVGKRIVQAFSSKRLKAETIWESAGRAGKRTVILNYPLSWPSTTKNNIVIGGNGLHLDENRDGLLDWRYKLKGADSQVFCLGMSKRKLRKTAEKKEDAYFFMRMGECQFAILEKAKGWPGLPGLDSCLEVRIDLSFENSSSRFEKKGYYLLIEMTPDNGRGKKILVYKGKNHDGALAELSVGKWSKVIEDLFVVNNKKTKGYFRIKILRFDKEEKELWLMLSPILLEKGNYYPARTVKTIIPSQGFPFTNRNFSLLQQGFIDWNTFLELEELENLYWEKVIEIILKTEKWDMFIMHGHTMDTVYHQMLPLISKNRSQKKTLEKYELRGYCSLDKLLGKIMALGGKNCVYIVVSDHGASPYKTYIDIEKVLAGCNAYAQRSCYIYLKGKTKPGTVKYEKQRDKVIRVLMNYIDPETGENPFAFALRKEDAQLIGLKGNAIGDIVYSIKSGFGGYGGMHGASVSTHEYQGYSLRGVLIISGPGVKRGLALQRRVGLEDIVPTACYLTDIPLPGDTEGGIIYQAINS